MEGIDLDRIARPRQHLAAGGEAHVGELDSGPRGPWLPGNHCG
jgi:hypothetical protein